MATRAERFKAELQRSGPKREASNPKRATATSARISGAGAAPGEKAAGARGGVKATGNGKTVVKEGRLKSGRGTYVLEPPATAARPSRKSTRKSKSHVKSGTELTTRTQERVRSPARRHAGRN